MGQELNGVRKGVINVFRDTFFLDMKYIKYNFSDARGYSVFQRVKKRPVWPVRRAHCGRK